MNNEMLGKVIPEIILKHSTRLGRHWKEEPKTDERITELLNQPDWKGKSKFEVVENNYDDRWV